MHVAVSVTKTGVKAITSLKTGVPLDCEYNFSPYLRENITHFKYKNQLINLLQRNMRSWLYESQGTRQYAVWQTAELFNVLWVHTASLPLGLKLLIIFEPIKFIVTVSTIGWIEASHFSFLKDIPCTITPCKNTGYAWLVGLNVTA